MKRPLFVLALIFALFAGPAAAQQGPAGVPGAPLIGAVIAPPPAPAKETPDTAQRKRGPADCSKAKQVEQCKARQEARRQAREACKDQKAEARKQCIRDALAAKK